eukprot:TRINITY_DN7684_c0_g1_i2.p1 TRINITY_DN7684_c0_g1~~TRINITY_DN7684_c0_g1_i2.p1  ORF type:complete len:229 (+),score=16.48 TRINITY_DN7684_c0_g1_i2:241-927(+)
MHNPAGSDQHILTMSPHPQENNLAHSTELTRGQSYARQAWVLGPAGGSFFLLGGLLLCLTTSGWDSFTSTLGGSPPTKCHSSLVREICDDNGDYGTNLESRVLLGLCGTACAFLFVSGTSGVLAWFARSGTDQRKQWLTMGMTSAWVSWLLVGGGLVEYTVGQGGHKDPQYSEHSWGYTFFAAWAIFLCFLPCCLSWALVCRPASADVVTPGSQIGGPIRGNYTSIRA